MKKVLALVLVCMLMLACVPASALELVSGADMYPVDTDITVSFYSQDGLNPHEKFADWTESPFHTGLAEQTGIKIDWSFPTTGTDGAVYTNTLIADPTNLPDIMGVHWMNDAAMYLDEEVIWDLTDYIQEYAPAYYAFLQTNPAYDRAMKTDDGKYYAFGFFREDGGWNDTYLGPVVRKDWLDECGLEVPKTISEFENVIRVFNEKYGAKFTFAWSRFKSTGISGAFDAYGASDEQWFIKDGKVQLAQTTDGWRSYMEWLNGLWTEGLLDQDCLSLDDTSIKAKVQNDEVGISITSMGQMNNWNKECEANGKEAVWVGIPYPTADDGSLAMVFGGRGIGDYTAVVTKSADEATMIACLQLLNYAYTTEGFLYWNYGVEGTAWEMNDEGTPVFLPLVADDTDTDPMVKYNGATWGACCIQATNLLYLKNSEAAIEANNTWYYTAGEEAASEWKWPSGTTYTVDETDELALINTGLSTYTSESFANFLTGASDIKDDATWQTYLDNYNAQYNLERITEIRQNCYDRYLAR